MNFKQIEMVGFKSFADPIKITFDNGITAIVGPNGCGKSNVADAIRWVLGEQSSKMLRGTSMQDVIFKGTEKRKSMSFCEVSLMFDNSNKIFKSEYDEICITRKLYRSGDSEYMLNRTNCRLKDIIEILHDSGIGKSGYSIIGQGKVEEIINSKPIDRRAIFEEAAGIAGFKAKKVDAERKLERTRDNLVRITDIVSELDRQLKPLRHQAEVAKKYLELKEKLKSLEVNAYIYQYDYAAANKAEIETKINAILEEMALRQGKLDQVILDYNQTFEHVNNIDSEITTLRDIILNITVQLEKQAGQTNLINEKIQTRKSEAKRLQEELNKINQNDEVFNNELNTKWADLNSKKNKLAQLNSQMEEVSAFYEQINSELTKSEDDAKETQRKLFETLSKLGDVKAQISALNAEKTTYSEQLKNLENNLNNVKVKLSESRTSVSECKQNIEVLTSNKNKLNAVINEHLSEQNRLDVQFKDAEANLNGINSNILSLEHRKKMLEDMQREYEGYNGSVKRLLTDAERNVNLKNKIVGVLASLIKVPQTYQAAIEMALGSAVQNVVTHSDDGAKELINYLKQREYGRVTFLPINTIKERYFDNAYRKLLNTQGVYGVASELISYNKNISNVISNLLGGTVVVDNINTAVNLAKQSHYSFRIVTLDGDVINPQGSITGGSKKAQVANLLSRETEIETSIKNLQKLQSDKEETLKTVSVLSNKLAAVNEVIKQKSNELREVELNLAAETERYEKHNSISLTLEEESNSLTGEIAKTSQIIEAITNEVNKISNTENLEDNPTSTFEENSSQFSQMRLKRDEYANKLTNLKVEIASVSSEILSLEGDIERIKFALSNNQSIREELNKSITENNAQLMAFESMVTTATHDESVNLDIKKLDETKAQVNELTTQKSTCQATLRQLEEERMALTAEVDKLQDKKHAQDIALSKIDTDIETLQERVWTEYELTYNTAQEYKLPEFDVKQGLVDINTLRREINKLGNVNVNAIEDVKLIEERHGSMYVQAQDLIKAEEDLKQIIKDLSEEMTARFDEAFNQINANFGVVFKELFGGGNARLQLVQTEDMLEAGVDIMAEPPGKKLSNITLLSGGEKSLTAIAILFAILRLRPMPFCLLDEIEAALDEANVARFARYLQRYSESTQFIVITHKKPTMEHADALFGVTMEEKGVSKVVSVKLTDAIKNIEEK